MFDALGRALADCVRPSVIALTFMPLAVIAVLALGLGYFFWEPAVDALRGWFTASGGMQRTAAWLHSVGMGWLPAVAAPVLLVLLVTPPLVAVTLLAVGVLMAPALASLVATRRFPQLERCRGASFVASVRWSLGAVLMALAATLVSLPLWFVPPLMLVLPPLIWGWLTYRVMAFDALAVHASAAERREIFRLHRTHLLLIGVACGALGAVPTVVWASGLLFAAAFVVLVPLAVWLYTLVFALSSLWFSHYCLAALHRLRAVRPYS